MLHRTDAEQDAIQDKLMEAVRWQGPNLPYIAIISGHTSGGSELFNANSHADLEQDLKGFPKKELHGSWNGKKELSWLVVLSGDVRERVKQYAVLDNLLHRYHQEAYLVADRYRDAKLVYENGETVKIGRLRQISADEASREQGYSYDPATETYWAAK